MSIDATPELIALINQHHSNLLSLCESLENIANDLPRTANKQACLTLSRSIYPIVYEAHEFEENYLFPYLLDTKKQNEPLVKSLDRLKFEHYEDETFAQEISEALHEFVTGENTIFAEKLAYMLRGFFEGVRRHLAFEKEHLLPLLKNNRGFNVS